MHINMDTNAHIGVFAPLYQIQPARGDACKIELWFMMTGKCNRRDRSQRDPKWLIAGVLLELQLNIFL